MNQVNLIGRLSKDIEVRYTQSGKAVGSGSIAVNRRFKSANGERQADFINFVIWDKAAENLANFTHKGSQVGLGGEWQTRNYENNSGQKVYVNELVVSNFDLLEQKASTQTQSNLDKVDPFARQNTKQAPNKLATPGNSELDISDDDLPFD
ncbi:single-stranded DNA-binding protein [Leuconostoc citreum]|uniref:single-stranded DNA-binding protein n=1 Tax=Leuconostoc citreum TaxID=33964 RepID=UPI001886EB5B|nr:single-stranded DNA-binding protein [Leuconostoc citreum]QOY98376.1 single-stranded DNA-binding protein [Leuconostoc citreum]